MSDAAPSQEQDLHKNEKAALDCLQWLHNRLKTTAFYPEEFKQAHESLMFIEQLALDLATKIQPKESDEQPVEEAAAH